MKDFFSVLIADESDIFVRILKGYLAKDSRFNVIGVAKDEDDEISFIDEHKPDIVITNLKKKNGWTGLEIIKQYKHKNYKPIFFVISGSVYDFMSEISRMNIKYYLNKPFRESDLKVILDKIYEDNK